MKVYKFGGASLKDAEAIRNVASIIGRAQENTIIVASAMGKMTNALEEVVELAYDHIPEAPAQLNTLFHQHLDVARKLLDRNYDAFETQGRHLIGEQTELLKNASEFPYNYLYDQIVSLGELLSTLLLHLYLDEIDIPNKWVDVREVIETDDHYRDARVMWEATSANVNGMFPALLENGHIVTQGFIGGTTGGQTTTMGREGSDYTASILAFCCHAQDVTIWKDVPGVLNADPRFFGNATKIDFLSYHDAIEMSYFGAKVIHPKTIKPLQNQGIPLYVKSFIEPSGKGTVISEQTAYSFVPPMIVVKPQQVMLSIFTRDYSFIAEEHLSLIYDLFARHRIKVNMLRNSAISLNICFDSDPHKLQAILPILEREFDVEETEHLRLITLKYYNEQLLKQMKEGKEVILEELASDTAHILLREDV